MLTSPVQVRLKPQRMYMEHQREITSRMRAILVDWLVDVAEEYHLCAETLFLSVNYLDRYLAIAAPVARQELQLVGMACCFIAAYAPPLIARGPRLDADRSLFLQQIRGNSPAGD